MTDSKQFKCTGAASIIIELRDGDITIKHGEHHHALLAHLDNAPIGTWDKLWHFFENLGFVRDAGEWGD